MRAEEKSAEAVVARKAGNSAGAKGRRTKEQSERSDSNRAERSPESRTERSFPVGGTQGEQGQAGTVEPGWASLPAATRRSSARLIEESNARRTDGTGGRRGEPRTGSAGGETQAGRGGDRQDDDRRTRTSLSPSRHGDSSETRVRALDAESRKAGRDTEAERGEATAWDTDGNRSAGAASVAASSAADLRSAV